MPDCDGGDDRLEARALATIAVENYGVVGGINGGYFSGAKPIGVLRRQGRTDNAKFWPNRSAFGWNESGEFIFIDGKIVNNIGSVHEYDEYTEMMQAGPLLVKEGEAAPNTEDVDPAVLNRRHPRTFVGTDGSRVFWGVVDGRDNMHSVGMTIEELRTFCIKGAGADGRAESRRRRLELDMVARDDLLAAEQRQRRGAADSLRGTDVRAGRGSAAVDVAPEGAPLLNYIRLYRYANTRKARGK